MRDIKFRAWCNQKNEWISYNKLSQETSIDFEFSLQQDYFILDGIEIDRWIIEQYTGLKDKNGKEIYEGDILLRTGEIQGSSIRDMSDNNPDMRLIKWRDDEARLTFCTIDGRFGVSGFTYCKDNINNLYEIIGNIHENPELL